MNAMTISTTFHDVTDEIQACRVTSQSGDLLGFEFRSSLTGDVITADGVIIALKGEGEWHERSV